MTAQRSGKLLEIVAESRTVFYYTQWFLQLVLQRFRSLQGMSHCAMYCATSLALALRDKLHSVTAPLGFLTFGDRSNVDDQMSPPQANSKCYPITLQRVCGRFSRLFN